MDLKAELAKTLRMNAEQALYIETLKEEVEELRADKQRLLSALISLEMFNKSSTGDF